MRTYKNLLNLQKLKEYGLMCTEIVGVSLGKDRILSEMHKDCLSMISVPIDRLILSFGYDLRCIKSVWLCTWYLTVWVCFMMYNDHLRMFWMQGYLNIYWLTIRSFEHVLRCKTIIWLCFGGQGCDYVHLQQYNYLCELWIWFVQRNKATLYSGGVPCNESNS